MDELGVLEVGEKRRIKLMERSAFRDNKRILIGEINVH